MKFVNIGPQCVPRRIYSIATGGSRPQFFVAVEGIHYWRAIKIFTEDTCFNKKSEHQIFTVFSFLFWSFFCQRPHACVSSAVVLLVPAHCRDLTARGVRSLILKGPWGWTPAAWVAAWWKWVSTHPKKISLALWARGTLAFSCDFISHLVVLPGETSLEYRFPKANVSWWGRVVDNGSPDVSRALPYSHRIYVSVGWAGLLLCGKFGVLHEQLSSCTQLRLTWQRFW